MLRLLGLSIVCLTIGACKKEQQLPVTRLSCEEISFQKEWPTEPLKTDYTIQFPDNYTGPGLTGFEGPIFIKTNKYQDIQFSYAFCNGLYCTEFGDVLAEPAPSTIQATDKNGQLVDLTVRVTFCRGEASESILYYKNNVIDRTGKYFMKINGKLVEALDIYYPDNTQEEIMTILKTIKKS